MMADDHPKRLMLVSQYIQNDTMLILHYMCHKMLLRPICTGLSFCE